MTIILGINAFHADASACLLRDGRLIAAAEEERFRRVKHWAGFPDQAISYCLRQAGIELSAIDHVAINRDNQANFARKMMFTALHRPSLRLVRQRLAHRRQWDDIGEQFSGAFPGQTLRAKIHSVEHHVAHLSSAYHVSPFKRAVVVSVDGFGDFTSTCWGHGEDSNIHVDGRVYFPHSLGLFYEAMTQYLGFPNYGDEYKVMGLAPYGEPRYLEPLRKVVKVRGDGKFKLGLEFFSHWREGANYGVVNGMQSAGKLFTPALEKLLGKSRGYGEALSERHRDIARSVQQVYEQAFFNLLNTLHERYQIDDLALAGGCANNSVANGKIFERTPFKRCYVQSASGDAGGALGAAYSVWHDLEEVANKARFTMNHAYWGPSYTRDDIDAALAAREGELTAAGCHLHAQPNEAKLCDWVAQRLAEGAIVGWFQGRMEWGPRALGNRSILADPRRTDMKDLLNRKIKRRESFRPFAPAVLREAVADWFETEDDVPFMMKVLQLRPDRREQVPAITHVDGSGRLQTVTRAQNPRFYRLLEAFAKQTKVPMLLNTSFNENEPVVCKPEEAIDCFLRTDMDVLVLEDRVAVRDRSK